MKNSPGQPDRKITVTWLGNTVMKEKDLADSAASGKPVEKKSLLKGLIICIVAGVTAPALNYVFIYGDQSTWGTVKIAMYNGPMREFYEKHFPEGMPMIKVSTKR